MLKGDFMLLIFGFDKGGVESIIDDQVTSRFKAEQLSSWNLLTRTSARFHHINRTLTFLWLTGFLIRYLILLPLRALLFLVGFTVLIIITHISERIPNPSLKKRISRAAMPICMRIICRAFSTVITFHNRENIAKHGGICVANHTSPIDVMILSCDNNYAMVGQRQNGILGFLERTVSKTGDHIWFERSEAGERKKVVDKLREHVDASKSPIIIFPEGTCINNTSVMMFKKGAFEVCGVVYPIAMKYDPRFGDPFWNSSEQSYGQYLFQMMTSWAIICDVWYLPPMHRLVKILFLEGCIQPFMLLQENETSVEFAYRTKTAIARRGGLVELEWDGGLKRARVFEAFLLLFSCCSCSLHFLYLQDELCCTIE
uniref:PlsC domain-containing protein n=1 Tax=Syphacia muris TaxID=451379 RepID=A0A0N5AXZ4_9BILA